MTRMNFLYVGVVVSVVALMAAAVVASGEVGNAELRLIEGVRSAVEAATPVSSIVLSDGVAPATLAVD